MIKFLSILIFLLVIATFGVLYVTKNKINGGDSAENMVKIGGNFTLTNQDGITVSDADFRGRVMLVFFGFTHCPDICPVTTATLTKTLGILGDKAANVAPIFISVDPKRDAPAVMKAYLANFDSRIVGLTGSDEQIKQAASVYKAYFSDNHDHSAHENEHEHEGGETDGGYAVDHSGFIYLMDKNGVYLQHFPYDVSADALANSVSNALK